MEARAPLSGREHERTGPSAADLARTRSSVPQQSRSTWKRRSQFWLRWAHVYISMFSLLVMLFFGITGVTLNHPDWVFGGDVVETTVSGVLPAESRTVDGVEFLVISEFVRQQHEVGGEVADFGIGDDGRGSISYRSPGYAADLFFDAGSGAYGLTVSEDGFVGTMNALHQGRDASSAWRLIIDVSGVLLVVIALTGLGIQLFMRKRRFTALAWSVVGAVATVVLIWMALG
ncbi:MAG: PepSY-associated TM helix domain-containing protein [Acidimicrobiia bacterium]|nr:PepSY-associated TM helix domain-containing protein [Acidimicrobiia bacterium]